jgi:hypothetical protein
LVASSLEGSNNAASKCRNEAMNMIRNLAVTVLILIGNSAVAAAPDDFDALLEEAWEWQLRSVGRGIVAR